MIINEKTFCSYINSGDAKLENTLVITGNPRDSIHQAASTSNNIHSSITEISKENRIITFKLTPPLIS